MGKFIYSRTTEKGRQSLYLLDGSKEHYLFTQKYFKGVKQYFHNKVNLSDALNVSKSYYDTALIRTKEKLSIYIRYIEKELDIVVLSSTAKKRKRPKKKYYKRENCVDVYSYEYNYV